MTPTRAKLSRSFCFLYSNSMIRTPTEEGNMRLLLVEENARIVHFMAKGLREQDFAVDVAKDGPEAFYHVSSKEYDLLIIDVALALKNGLQLCKAMRSRGITQPVLLLTSPDITYDSAIDFCCGADAYLNMPFDFAELLARIRFLVSRAQEVTPETIQIADLLVNTRAKSVTRGMRNIRLTTREYHVLEFLVLRASKLVSLDELTQHARHQNLGWPIAVADTCVKRLQRKIDQGFDQPLIQKVGDDGYVLSAEAEMDH